MYCISDQQIDFIFQDIGAHGIHIESLQYNLLDHICIIIEQNLDENGNFEEFYASTIKSFYKVKLREIEEETYILLAHKNHRAFSRNQFFLLLFSVFIGPFIGYNFIWMVSSGEKAGWNLPISIWGGSVAYSLFPFLILLVLFLTPDKLDPLFPKNSRIFLGIRPFIKIITPHCSAAEQNPAPT